MSAEIMERTGVIIHVEPLRSSTSGNPRYRVTFTDGSCFTTEHDIMDAYGIENPECTIPNRVRYGLRGGQIVTCKPDPETVPTTDYGNVPAHLAVKLGEAHVGATEFGALLAEETYRIDAVEPREWVRIYRRVRDGKIPGRVKG